LDAGDAQHAKPDGHEVSGDKAERERDKGDQSGRSHLFDTIPMERDGVEVI
jgi:hypothetical protein